MRWQLSWNETVRAAGLAALAERSAPAVRTSREVPYRWDPYEIWLSHARSATERAVPSAVNPASGSRD